MKVNLPSKRSQVHRILVGLALCNIVLFGALAPAHAADHVRFYFGRNEATVDGKSCPISETPILSAGRTFVPLRATAETLGCDVFYDAASRRIDIKKGDVHIKMGINCTVYTINGKRRFMDVAPYLSPTGTTMVPLRFIGEGIGLQVKSFKYPGKRAEVHITR